MSSGMAAEDYAGFGWLFDAWSSMVISILTTTEPLFAAISKSSDALLLSVGAAWLCLLFLNAARLGLIRGILGGLLIFAIILVGMRPAVFAPLGRGSVAMVEIQQKPLIFVLSAHAVFASALADVLKNQTVAGSIIPAESATRDAVERSAQAFGDSDLSRLMRDYNAQCSPDKSAFVEPGHAATRDALNAVGLLGGTLGIPEESITMLAQAKAGFSGLWDAVSNPYLTIFGDASTKVQQASDIGAIRANRARGIVALEKMDKPFSGGTYALPTKSNWTGTYSGAADAKSDYLRVQDFPPALAAQMENNVGAYKPSEGKGAVISINPTNCVEAYRVAQFAAEQAYQALEGVGTVAAGGQGIGSESGAISAALAWQRTIARTVSGGESSSGAANNAGGISAAFQLFKSWWSWLDLQTLMPAYVAGLAWLFCLVLLVGPIALLIAPLRGVEVLLSWFSLLLFPLLALIFADLVAVMASLVLAGVSASQAAAASGWQGAGADLDVVRGSTTMIAALMLPVSGWMASQMTGVSLGGLAGSAGGAVATATYAASVVGSAVSMASRVSRMVEPREPRGNNNNRGPGNDGGGGRSANPGGPANMGVAQSIQRPNNRASGSSGSKQFNLNPAAPAANAEKFGGRTPRSMKPKKED